MNARTRSFPAQPCSVMRWHLSVLSNLWLVGVKKHSILLKPCINVIIVREELMIAFKVITVKEHNSVFFFLDTVIVNSY